VQIRASKPVNEKHAPTKFKAKEEARLEKAQEELEKLHKECNTAD
jgi:hypothetical protein